MHMIKVERLQCNLRSLENENNERKMLQDDNRLGVNVNLCSPIFQESGPVGPTSSRKMRVLAHFTIHMVEIIQLYTDQPHTWLGFRHHPSSNHTYGWTQSQIHGIIRNEPHCG